MQPKQKIKQQKVSEHDKNTEQLMVVAELEIEKVARHDAVYLSSCFVSWNDHSTRLVAIAASLVSLYPSRTTISNA